MPLRFSTLYRENKNPSRDFSHTGLGGGIFARLFCAVGAVGWEAFPPFGIKPNIKAKHFSNPFKRKRVARKIKELKENCFALLAEFRRAENRGRGFEKIPSLPL